MTGVETDPLIAALRRFFGGRRDASVVSRRRSERLDAKRLEVERLLMKVAEYRAELARRKSDV